MTCDWSWQEQVLLGFKLLVAAGAKQERMGYCSIEANDRKE